MDLILIMRPGSGMCMPRREAYKSIIFRLLSLQSSIMQLRLCLIIPSLQRRRARPRKIAMGKKYAWLLMGLHITGHLSMIF